MTAAATAAGPAPVGTDTELHPSTPLGGSLGLWGGTLPAFKSPAAHALAAGTATRHAVAAQRIWQGHQAGRSIITSPQPQQGNAPPQGLLAAWHSPQPGRTPIPNSMQHHTTSGSPSSSVLPSLAGRAPAAVLLPAPARSCPGLTPGQLEQAGWGAWTCPMPSRVACLQCHELPWAASGEAAASVGKSWHPPPCSYSQKAGATPALEGRPPGCTRPWLEENAHSRAEVGTTGCCRMVQHPNIINVPGWLGLQALRPATWAVLQKPGCTHNTCPLVCSRGSEAAAPAESRGPSTAPPCHHPLTMGPSWGTSTIILVQGNLCYLIVGSTKPGQRQTLQKGGRSYIPQGPPKEAAAEGCGQGVIGRPAGRAGQGWTGASACHSGDYASGLTFIPIHDLPRREGGELHWEAGLTALDTPEPHQHPCSKGTSNTGAQPTLPHPHEHAAVNLPKTYQRASQKPASTTPCCSHPNPAQQRPRERGRLLPLS